MTSLYDYVFPENGLVAYKNGELIARQVSLSLFELSAFYSLSLSDSQSVFVSQLQSNLSLTATLVREKRESKVVIEVGTGTCRAVT